MTQFIVITPKTKLGFTIYEMSITCILIKNEESGLDFNERKLNKKSDNSNFTSVRVSFF